MKIQVMGSGHKIRIIIPNMFITGFPSRKLIAHLIATHAGKDIPLSEKQLNLLLKELKRATKMYKGLHLVEVESANGDQVIIDL